jgi:TetR/AcrR family transcriptional regulator
MPAATSPPSRRPASAPAPAPARRERDPAAAKQALIAAAVAEFAGKGFAGARVDEIAATAGVNKQLVYHYFDNKQGLYLVALESVYAEIREKEKKLTLDALEPMEAMAKLVAFSFDYLAEHPEFIALLADENRNQGAHLRASERLQKMHSPFIDMLEATLKRGVAAGVFRADFDAINLYISIAGISYFFFSNNHTLSAIFGKALDARGALRKRRKHVVEFALNALRP